LAKKQLLLLMDSYRVRVLDLGDAAHP